MTVASEQVQTKLNEFKQFVKRHPKLIQEVRKENKGWQEIYEHWILLGEEDKFWANYRDSDSEKEKLAENEKNDFLSKMVHAIKNMDSNQMNEQIYKMSQSISSLQGLINQFGGGSKQSGNGNGGSQPFSFRKD
jgi:predicted translin family RNA/ssDNA-binding protein